MEGKEDLRDAIGLCMALAEENPCRMKDMTMGTIAKALRALVSKEYTHGMNQRQLGKYLGVDARTIQRWAKKYPDFPKGRHDGDKEVTYEMEEVVRWKRKHEKGGPLPDPPLRGEGERIRSDRSGKEQEGAIEDGKGSREDGRGRERTEEEARREGRCR